MWNPHVILSVSSTPPRCPTFHPHSPSLPPPRPLRPELPPPTSFRSSVPRLPPSGPPLPAVCLPPRKISPFPTSTAFGSPPVGIRFKDGSSLTSPMTTSDYGCDDKGDGVRAPNMRRHAQKGVRGLGGSRRAPRRLRLRRRTDMPVRRACRRGRRLVLLDLGEAKPDAGLAMTLPPLFLSTHQRLSPSLPLSISMTVSRRPRQH
jgi:hypothetical protein